MSADTARHGRLAHNAAFRARLVAGDTLVGTFVKTPHPGVIEILGASDLDFLILDAEHAPFDRAAIDLCVMTGVGCGCPVMVRVPVATTDWIMTSLDCGAAGIMAPHVGSAAEAETIARRMRYEDGTRGFTPSPRAGEFGRRSIAEHLDLVREETVLVCQIEDRPSVEAAAEIAAVDGVDALFIGPADLAVSLGLHSIAEDKVTELCRRTFKAAGSNARSGLFVPDARTIPAWRNEGATLFVSASDHVLLRTGASALRAAADGPT